MKPEVLTETMIKPKRVGKKITKLAKVLTLDQLEEEMTLLATSEGDVADMMANEIKFNMLEKVANLKLHRLQLKELEKSNEPVDVKPIEVKFISSKTNDNLNRLEQIESSVKESLNIKQDA